MPLEAPTYVEDFVITNPITGDPRSEGDDHIRNIKAVLKSTFPGFSGRMWRSQAKAANTAAVRNDNSSLFTCSAALTITPDAAATLGNGWALLIKANGGDVTVDPAENVNGGASAVLSSGSLGILLCTGAEFFLSSLGESASIVSPAQIAANQNDYSPTGLTGANTLRISSDARRNITGLATGRAGRKLTVMNVGTFPIPFTYEDALSVAANRFAFGITLGGGQTIVLEYDATSSRWRLVSAPSDPIGASRDFMGTVIPEGYFAEDGSNKSRVTYASLFNEIGTIHGVGDGSTTFGLPDSRRRVHVGSGGTGTGTLGNATGNTGGAETHTLASNEGPDHQHYADPGITSDASWAWTTFGVAGGGSSTRTIVLVGGGPALTGLRNSSSGQPHNNMQPSLVVTKIIRYC